MTHAQLRAAIYAYLGTTSSDRAYPAANVTRWLNDALNQLRADLPIGYVQTRGTWAADGGAGRVYTLSTQDVPVTALQSIVDVRVTSTTGAKLREIPYEQLGQWGGLAYALSGADESAVLTTSEGVADGATLYVVYETWPAELSADGDTPSWLPARFHDVPALMATATAFASGDEGTFPPHLASLLFDRQAQLISHTRRRSADVMLTRAADNLLV